MRTIAIGERVRLSLGADKRTYDTPSASGNPIVGELLTAQDGIPSHTTTNVANLV